MRKEDFRTVTIITAENHNYLKLKEVENSEELIGKPVRMIFSKDGKLPEFEDVSLVPEALKTEEVEEVKEEASKKSKKK